MPCVDRAFTSSMASSPTVATWLRWSRSEEHTSELQSLAYLVCRLLLEKKKKKGRLVKCVFLREGDCLDVVAIGSAGETLVSGVAVVGCGVWVGSRRVVSETRAVA